MFIYVTYRYMLPAILASDFSMKQNNEQTGLYFVSLYN